MKLLTALLFFSLAAQAVQAEGNSYINADTVRLLKSPGGAQAGLLYRRTAVKPVEVRGDWTFVWAGGWVRNDELSASVEAASPPAGPASPLTLTGYSLETLSKMQLGDKARVRLTLSLKNTSAQPVKKWSAILEVQSAQNAPIVKSPVQGGTEEIAPNAAGEVSYYWAEGEREYNGLAHRTKDEIKVNLSQIKAE